MNDAGYLDLVRRIVLLAPAPFSRLAFDGFGDGDHSGQIAELFGILVERVAGDKEAEDFFFVGKAVAFFPVSPVGQIVAVPAVDRGVVKQSE